jgi:hypothetical protein
MNWHLSYRAEAAARALADRHYNRQSVGAPQFVPPGSCIVLRTLDRLAVWVTLAQRPEYVDHDWPNAWNNSLFRNEGAGLSSELIREAIAATLAIWPHPPESGMVTFIDPDKVRRKRDPGRCYLRAGFHREGYTKGGLLVLRISRFNMPEPCPALGTQRELEAV